MNLVESCQIKSWKKLNKKEKWQRNIKYCDWARICFVNSTPNSFDDSTNSNWKKNLSFYIKGERKRFPKINISDKTLNFIRNSMYSVVNDFDGLHLDRDYHLIIKWLEKLAHHRFVRYQWKKES